MTPIDRTHYLDEFRYITPFVSFSLEPLYSLFLRMLSPIIEKIKALLSNCSSSSLSLQERVVQLQEESIPECEEVDKLDPRLEEIRSEVTVLMDYLYTLSLASPGVAECFQECNALMETLKEEQPISAILNRVIGHLNGIEASALEMGELPCFNDLKFLNLVNALRNRKNLINNPS